MLFQIRRFFQELLLQFATGRRWSSGRIHGQGGGSSELLLPIAHVAGTLENRHERRDEPVSCRAMVTNVTEHPVEYGGVEVTVFDEQKQQKARQRFVIEYLTRLEYLARGAPLAYGVPH